MSSNTSRSTRTDEIRNSSSSANVSSNLQQSDGSTVIRRTLVERGVRPVSDDNIGNSHSSNIAAITTIARQHEDEQRELQELNVKFAVYLDRVQILEEYNQRLTADLNRLKETWGGDATQLQASYDPQLRILREGIDNAIRDHALTELQLKRYEYDLWQIQQQIAAIDDNYEINRINFLKKELDSSNIEYEQIRNKFDQRLLDLSKQRNLMENLLKDIDSLKNEVDNQQLERMIMENEIQTLREHAAFQDAIYQTQREELINLSSPVLDVSGFYRSELARAISEIRQDFEVLSQSQVHELEEYYRIKTEQIRQEIETENERKRLLASEGVLESMDKTVLTSSIRDNQNDLIILQTEHQHLQSQLDAIIDDLEKIQEEILREKESYDQDIIQLREQISNKQETVDSILQNNISLRFEMSTYRHLLDVEEQHLNRMEQGQALTGTLTTQVQSTSTTQLQNTPTTQLQSTSTTELQNTPTTQLKSTSTTQLQSTPTTQFHSASPQLHSSSTQLQNTPTTQLRSTSTTQLQSTPTTQFHSTSPQLHGSSTQLHSSSTQLHNSSPQSASTSSLSSTSLHQNQQVPDRVLGDLGTKKMTVQKTARGSISFDSVDLETDSIVLVNEKYSGNQQSFRNWTIRREVDQQPEVVYQFPSTFSLRPRQTVRIFSRRSPNTARSSGESLVADKVDTWGIGRKMVTRLFDDINEEKAIITQIFQ